MEASGLAAQLYAALTGQLTDLKKTVDEHDDSLGKVETEQAVQRSEMARLAKSVDRLINAIYVTFLGGVALYVAQRVIGF